MYPHHLAYLDKGNKTQIILDCHICKEKQQFSVPTKEYEAYKEGKGHIQIVMPSVSSSHREMLISGICPVCWDKTFASEE